MLFSSIEFLLVFFPVTYGINFLLPKKWRNYWLLLASLFFYAWGEPRFVFVMIFSICANYTLALLIEQKRDKRNTAKAILILDIVINLGILTIFKYLNFITGTLHSWVPASRSWFPETSIVLPIGISFFTFQALSYVVDVYRGIEAQKNPAYLGLYIALFPQLIAGPIVRYHDINEQISARTVTVEQFASGLERFIVGLSKKVLLANTFALVCDTFYNADFFSYGAYAAWVAAVAYALQIYYDFSGYSDMAIGLARLFGFDLLENFNYPYAASSITDFWKRWHISLTNFFRDYLYIPLGGNRKGKARTVINRFIVFFTTGLWHGAAFNFILWGLAHGVLMTAERSLTKKKNAVLAIFHRIFTLFSVLFLWVLFRNGTKETIKIILKMFGVNWTLFISDFKPLFYDEILSPKIDISFYVYAILGILFAFPWWRKCKIFYTDNFIISVFSLALKYIFLGILLILCYANLAGNSYNPFIYFRF